MTHVPGGFSMDNYTIIRNIGSGAYGLVVEAVRNDSRVAIKLIDRNKYEGEQAKYLDSELRILMSLRHKNIVTTFEVGNKVRCGCTERSRVNAY